MSEKYDPNSVNAVLSRIETKLDTAIETQQNHARAIGKLWGALGRIDVRVAGISATVAGIILLIKIYFGH